MVISGNKVFNNRINKLEEYLSRLEEIRKVSKEKFLSDWKSQDLALRNLQVAIEACIDIGEYLITINNWNVPETYVETIKVLQKNGVIKKEFAEKMVDLVKFRNIIVHDYLYIDYKKVYKNLQRLDEFRNFVKVVVEYLKKKKN